MIDANDNDYNNEENLESFVVDPNDSSAFFNMNPGMTNDVCPDFGIQNSRSGQNSGFDLNIGSSSSFTSPFNFGGSSTNDVIRMGGSDPSSSCNGNCGACVWSMFCKSNSLRNISNTLVPRIG